MSDTRTYPCTESQLVDLENMLKAHGVAIDTTKPGEADESGWDISWEFPDPARIAVTVHKHPFAEEGMLFSKLNGIFAPPS